RSKAYGNFERSIKWSLYNRKLVLGLTAVLLAASGFGIYRVGTEFLPATDEGFVSITVNMPDNASVKATGDVIRKIEERLKSEDDVDVYVSLTGGTQQGLAQGTGEADRGELYVKLKPLSERDRSVFEFVDDIQPDIQGMGGEGTEINFNLQTAAGSSPNTLSFTMTDTDQSRLEKAASMAVARLSEIG